MVLNRSFVGLVLVGLGLCAFVGYARAMDEARSTRIYVEFQADGKTCLVDGDFIECDKVLHYLRKVLKLPSGSEVRFKAGRSAPYAVIKRVMDEVRASECTTAAAYLSAPKPPPKP